MKLSGPAAGSLPPRAVGAIGLVEIDLVLGHFERKVATRVEAAPVPAAFTLVNDRLPPNLVEEKGATPKSFEGLPRGRNAEIDNSNPLP